MKKQKHSLLGSTSMLAVVKCESTEWHLHRADTFTRSLSHEKSHESEKAESPHFTSLELGGAGQMKLFKSY